MAKPERLEKPAKPPNHPQPVWFYPFEKWQRYHSIALNHRVQEIN